MVKIDVFVLVFVRLLRHYLLLKEHDSQIKLMRAPAQNLQKIVASLDLRLQVLIKKIVPNIKALMIETYRQAFVKT